jgi:hypothetical protein
LRGCEEAIARALIELAEKAATRLREKARWQLPLSIVGQLARRSPARWDDYDGRSVVLN